MAMHSYKSSSSSSAPASPNPRSSEISNPTRRSFTGNPFAKLSLITNHTTIIPSTPANSPSDFPRKNSVGVRESVQDLDDKENGKDHTWKQAKVRSPAASLKNFMSPTISASCKITESPRKKVLIERNEPSPTSIPSTEAKSRVRKVTFAEPLECGDLKPEEKIDALLGGVPNFEEILCSPLTSEDLSGETIHDDANVPLIPKSDPELSFETVHNINVPLTLKNAIDTTEPSFETVSEEPDCVNLDPTFRLSPTPPPASSTATILASLDADPLIPPYDPKTNYLCPRPQFLHYKPKPRMQVCSEREFEGSFISGIFSDTEEVTEDTLSVSSQKESEDVSSEEAGQISEPCPARTFMPDETVEAKEVPKPRFSMRSKAIALVLLLTVAFISVSITVYPVIDHTVFEEFYEVYESSEFSEFAKANFDRFSQIAKANFNGLARNFHIWFTKSLFSISELISNFRGVHNLAQLQYSNLTALHDYTVVNQYPIFGHGENKIGETPEVHAPEMNFQQSDATLEVGTDDHVEDISAEHYEVYEEQLQQDIIGVENASDAPESEEVLEGQPATTIESEQALQLAEAGNLAAKQAREADASFIVVNASESEEVIKGQPTTMIELEQDLQLAEAGNPEAKPAQDDDVNFNVQNQLGLNSEVTESEIHIEVCGAGNVDKKQAQENDAKFNVDRVGLKHWPGLDSEVAEIHTRVVEEKSVSTDAAIRGSEQRLDAIETPPDMVLYLLLCGGTVLIAGAGAALEWSRRSKRVASSVDQPPHVMAPNRPCFRNGPIEMEVVAEPWPSEMSGFQKSSSYSKKVVKELNGDHSMEKKRKKNYRRESFASSSDYSMASPSYSFGSLTVYEKIPSKQGHGYGYGYGDEETITPVRRSNRIRNLATSPSVFTLL